MFNIRIRGKQWYWIYKFDNLLYDNVDFIKAEYGRGKKFNYNNIFTN